MSDRATEIEVIDQYNARHRFDAKTHAWQWGVLAGTIDVDDHGIVEIIMLSEDDDEDGTVICIFPNPAKVGICRKDECQILPMREIESKSYQAGIAAGKAEVVREQAAEIATLRKQVARVTTWANFKEDAPVTHAEIGYDAARAWVREVGLSDTSKGVKP